jgi:hypothetical protein
MWRKLQEMLHTYSPMKMEQTQCSETLAFKLQTPVNHPEERIRPSKHGESFKSWIIHLYVEETARNTSYLLAYEDCTDRVFRNVGILITDAGESPRRKDTTLRTRLMFEIKKNTSETWNHTRWTSTPLCAWCSGECGDKLRLPYVR